MQVNVTINGNIEVFRVSATGEEKVGEIEDTTSNAIAALVEKMGPGTYKVRPPTWTYLCTFVAPTPAPAAATPAPTPAAPTPAVPTPAAPAPAPAAQVVAPTNPPEMTKIPVISAAPIGTKRVGTTTLTRISGAAGTATPYQGRWYAGTREAVMRSGAREIGSQASCPTSGVAKDDWVCFWEWFRLPGGRSIILKSMPYGPFTT